MAVETADIGISDAELFKGAVEPTPEPVSQEPERTDQPRDDQGRFAKPEPEKPAVEPPKAEQPAQEGKDTDAQVPSWRLREVSEARQRAEQEAREEARQRLALQARLDEYERKLSDLQKPKQEPIDFFQNPDQALEQRLNPFQSELQQLRLETRLANSRAIAIAIHGKDAVAEMNAAVEKAMADGHPDIPHLQRQMRDSQDPVGVVMQWYQRDKLLRETGGDVNAYRQKLEGDLLKDPAFLAKAVEAVKAQANTQRPNVQIPPSINKGGTAASAVVDANDASDAAMFRDAVNYKRR